MVNALRRVESRDVAITGMGMLNCSEGSRRVHLQRDALALTHGATCARACQASQSTFPHSPTSPSEVTSDDIHHQKS